MELLRNNLLDSVKIIYLRLKNQMEILTNMPYNMNNFSF